MNFLIRLKKDRALLFSVLIALLSLSAMILGGIFAGFVVPFFGNDYYTALLLQECFAIVFILLLLYKSETLHTVTRSGSGLVHAAQVGAYPLVLIGFVAMSMATLGAESGAELQPIGKIVIYFLSMLSIGIAEEFAFRGIIGEALIARYGTSYIGTWKATAIGGVIFGFAHMSNLFSADPFGVLIQVAMATVLGMLFSAIYYRTGNLWICVLLHAGLDAGSLLDSGLYGTGTISDVVSSFSLINLTPCITYGLPVLFLLRRKKNHEVALWFGEYNDEKEEPVL